MQRRLLTTKPLLSYDAKRILASRYFFREFILSVPEEDFDNEHVISSIQILEQHSKKRFNVLYLSTHGDELTAASVEQPPLPLPDAVLSKIANVIQTKPKFEDGDILKMFASLFVVDPTPKYKEAVFDKFRTISEISKTDLLNLIKMPIDHVLQFEEDFFVVEKILKNVKILGYDQLSFDEHFAVFQKCSNFYKIPFTQDHEEDGKMIKLRKEMNTILVNYSEEYFLQNLNTFNPSQILEMISINSELKLDNVKFIKGIIDDLGKRRGLNDFSASQIAKLFLCLSGTKLESVFEVQTWQFDDDLIFNTLLSEIVTRGINEFDDESLTHLLISIFNLNREDKSEKYVRLLSEHLEFKRKMVIVFLTFKILFFSK